MAVQDRLITLTADIVAAHVSNNSVAVGDIANLVQRVHGALAGLDAPKPIPDSEKKTPIVSMRASIKPDYIVCLECGKRQKTLKRHIQTAHGMTPDQYRKNYGLPDTYLIVAPNYSRLRQELAKSSGLGRPPRGAAPAPSKTPRRKRAQKASPAE